MSTKLLTAPARLRFLLPWLNGAFDQYVYAPGDRPEDFATRTDYKEIRHALDDFVRSFDGSAGAGYLAAEPDDGVEALTDDAIGDLEAILKILLEQGFGEPSLQGDMCSLALTSVRVAVRSAGRTKPRWKTNVNGRLVLDGPAGQGVKARRDWNAPGAYAMRVLGSTVDLVPFLMVHLLTQAEMVGVKRCERRDQPPWADCPHVFIIDPAKRGRPQRFCAESCGRRYKEIVDEQSKRGRKKR